MSLIGAGEMTAMMNQAPLPTGTAPRAPVSIVCVFNDSEVLASCLEASVRAGQQDAPDTELIPLDNRSGAFATAGDALNQGVRQARNAVVAFVHQDVVLHSLASLESAAGELLRTPDIGLLGALGIDREGSIIGRIRDRVVPIGESTPEPRDADTLDEVLFLARREQLLRAPILNISALAWHAYAVEYSLRIRREGKRASTINIPLTHNSVSTNIQHLDLAHRWVGASYPEFLPIHTTCGTVHRWDGPFNLLRTVRRWEGARKWWFESRVARDIARRLSLAPVILCDIRQLIDAAARLGGKKAIRALDVEQTKGALPVAERLSRFGAGYSASSGSLEDAANQIGHIGEKDLLLVTGLSTSDVEALYSLGRSPRVVGYSWDTGAWILVGIEPEILTPLWDGWRNKPLARFTSTRRAR